MSDTFEQAKAFFLQGLQHLQHGRLETAERQFEASLALLPGRASTLVNLGAVRVALGRHESALPVLEEALAQEPGDAAAWVHHATALAELGRLGTACASVDKALALDPRLGPAWSLRGRLLKDLGEPQQAMAALEQAIALHNDVDMNLYMLAGLRGTDAPAAPPRAYVQLLFDGYADGFDRHLVQELGYQVPERLVAPWRDEGLQAGSALDLGCGTGLCGRELRPLARRVVGVDLSAGMLARARALGVYDALLQADVAEHLAATPERHDLVAAADVFIYVGALAPVFAGVARVLAPGGRFAFSVEDAGDAGDLVLRPSLRYAHSQASVEALAATHGLEVVRIERQAIRRDQGQPVAGLLCWLCKGK